ncbi:hypothetical protein VOLCADRAFT_97411 [Volvox carteri f. nagariensis]|uniref:Uncharacterized protein n=1 Tax=Volvox carteri f. nagariensis TaxID=3068 RepID=D8UCP5_VOLCA|nr:uncharacterized protein VOLCADRAFT_97411 [Volvox carteri f. nagariensis]EFJ42528.1 hypothetical protein VOLCADRAFT_97411 [Volvox carteri f. nagariensis]|eukprot:XP_002956384.1 hypothetical protein VOLCADRAFT_97411 [Volvox carteri f. nagariensis]
MAEEDILHERAPSLTGDDARHTLDAAADEQLQEPATLYTQHELPKKEESEPPRRPAFLSCKWPEGTDWCVALAGELTAMGLPVVNDAKHRSKLHDVEALIRDSCCVVMLVTPGFYHALANKPPGNRALKEIKFALQYGKPLLAAVHASYCGQNPLPSLLAARDLTLDSVGEHAWTFAELNRVARAHPIWVFKGGDGFDGYQREIIRQVTMLGLTAAAATAAAAARVSEDVENPAEGDGVAGSGASSTGGVKGRSPISSESEEKRLREVLRVAGLAKRLPSLQEGHIHSLQGLEKALRRGRLGNKPYNWHDNWIQRVTQGLAPLLVPLMAQEEPREFDRDGKPRPRRGALPLTTVLDLAGQGPVLVGPRGAAAVAAMIRDVCGAHAAAARRQQQFQQQLQQQHYQQQLLRGQLQSPRRRHQPPLYGTATTILKLTYVDVSDCALGTGGAVDLLAAITACPSITTLLLGGNGIDDDLTKEFEVIVRRASSSAAAASGVDGVAGALTGLRTLGLDRNTLTDVGAAATIAVLHDYKVGVTALDLSGNVGLGTATVAALVRSLRASGPQRLIHVGLAGTQLDEAALLAVLPVLLSQQRHGDGTAAVASSGCSTAVAEELDLTGNTVDSEVLAALATAAKQPGWGGGPRVLNLSGAVLRAPPPSRRHTVSTAEPSTSPPYSHYVHGGGNVASLAAALLHSHNLEELRLAWSGLNGVGLRMLISVLNSGGGGGGKPTGSVQQPLANLTVLDLTGNKLGPEGAALLGAVVPGSLPSLRHLVLDECGFGGKELGLLAGVLDVAPWVVQALQVALSRILNEDAMGAVHGSWTERLDDDALAAADRPRPSTAVGAAAAATAGTALEGLLRTWLAMDAASAAAEVKRLMLPPGAAAAAAAAFSSPHSLAARKAAAAVAGNSGPSRLAGLGCLMVHPVVQPVLEALRQLWDAVQSEAAAAPPEEGRPKSQMQSSEVRTAVRALDAAFSHLRRCAETPGLASLSVGRNSLAQEAGAPLGAAVSLSISIRHLGLHGIVQPPPPAPVAGTGAAAAAAAAAAAQGGPLAAAAAAARDARALLRLLYPTALVPPLPNPFAFRQAHAISAVSANWVQASMGPTLSRRPTFGDSRRETGIDAAAAAAATALETRIAAAAASDAGAAGVQSAFLPGLRSLDLTDAGIGAHNAAHLAEFVRHMPYLEQVVLDFNSLSSSSGGSSNGGTSDGSVSAAAAAAAAAASGSPAPDGTSALFADLAALPSLSYVSLNYACDAGAMFAVADHLLGLALLPPSPSAASSVMSNGPPACPNLRVLSLVGCPLDMTVARRLARALLHNTSLAVLRLGGGDPPEGVGPVGSRALGEALTSHRGLVELSLSGVGLTDNAARMLADALPQLPLLCKLDLSYNSLTSYGLEPLASALLARNRNALGAAAENRLNMQVYGNRISEELETRIQSLSVPTSMTHAVDRMPSVKRYGAPPPSRGEMGNGGSGFAGPSSPYATSGYGVGSRGSAPSSARSGGACNGLPAPPSLVPSPVLVRAPVPRPSPPQPSPPKGPRCASSPPRGASTSASAAAPSHPGLAAAAAAAAAAPPDPSRPLGSGKPTLLTAIPPPPPARRGSAPSDEGAGSAYGAATDSLDIPLRLNFTSTSKLTKIYGVAASASPPVSPSGGGGGHMADAPRRGSPGRPVSSPAPALKALPMALSQMRAIVPGAPYAAALVNAGNNPLLNGNRNRPTAGSTCTSAGAGAGGVGSGSDWYSGTGGAASLSTVRKSYPAADASGSGSGSSEAGNGGNDSAAVENGGGSGGGKGGKPKLSGASDHLMLRTKCHTPDWVNRMQEDYYKKVTAPRPPQQPPPPPGPPSEHLFRKLLCHDSEWQRSRQMEQMMRECAPEPKPQPVPGAPVSTHMVSSVAMIQRGPGGGSGGGDGASTGPRSGGGGARLSPPSSAQTPWEGKPAAAVSPEQNGVSSEPQHPHQPEHPVKPEASRPPDAADVRSPRGSTAATGGEAAEGGAAAEGGGEQLPAQPAPAPPGPPIRTAGASGNLGSEESMEVLAVRNTGRKKAAIEVLRIKKGSGAAGASGDGGDGGDGDEDENGDGDDDGDGAQEEASRAYGVGDGDGDGASVSGGRGGGVRADGEEAAEDERADGGALVQRSSEAADQEKEGWAREDEEAGDVAPGASDRDGGEQEYDGAGGAPLPLLRRAAFTQRQRQMGEC